MASSQSEPPKSLYPKLSGRAPTVGPEGVARHQRSRLIGAMVEAVSRQGYEEVTVGELVALAGVSKSAFYKFFENKEACFLVAYEEIVERGAEQIELAYRSGEGFEDAMTRALEKFVEAVAEWPPAARLVFVDSLSLGRAAVAPRERTAARYERMIQQGFDAAPLPGTVSPRVVRAVFGGMSNVAFHHLRDREEDRLGEHVPAIVDWGVSYRVAAGGGPGPGARLSQPALERWGTLRAQSAIEARKEELDWEEPANSTRSRRELSQRERILRATAQVVAAGSYGALTVPAISAAAGISNQTFYHHFASKEKAFLAAFDALALQAFEVTGAAFAASDDWLEAGPMAILALLDFMSVSPLFCRINFFELHAAGPLARDRAEAMLSLFAAFLQPEPLPPRVGRRPPKVVIDAIAGGIWSVVQHEITAGRGEALPDILPELLDIVLIPFEVE